MKAFAHILLLGGLLVLLASPHPLADEAEGEANIAPLPKTPLDLDEGRTITVYGGRVTTLVPTASDIAALRILAQPAHGHASVNPDDTIALVLTGETHTGALSLRYETATPDGRTAQHAAALEVIPSPQESSWGTGAHQYMLPVDASDRVIVEHGDRHRKVYVSGDGLTAADIAERHWGMSADDVTARWLQKNPEYGASEELALHTIPGFQLWKAINGFRKVASHWLLLERGHEYHVGRRTKNRDGDLFVRHMRGQSPLHPVFIGAWGTGDRPRITGIPRMFQALSRNIVVQDIAFSKGSRILGTHENILFDSVDYGSGGASVQGRKDAVSGFTMRNSIVRDAFREKPSVVKDGKWWPFDNRSAGTYLAGSTGVLFDGVIWDHNGWAPDFAPHGSVEGGQPPSMFSHNLYVQSDTRDVTMRNSITMRSASFGAQFRGGAYLADNLFLDNNIPLGVLGGDYKDAGPVGNYSLLDGNVVTVSARRGGGVPRIGALDWGVRNGAYLTSLVDNIVAHANDPDAPNDTAMAESALNHFNGSEKGVFTDDTIIWRWGLGRGGKDGTEANADGLDPETLNATTIQRYTADLLDRDTATIDDFGQYLRSLDSSDYAAATEDVLSYFRAGFGIDEPFRATATTLRFVPDMRGDGVRWDNRLNWDSGDLPGTVPGDSVDLGGNRVVFGGDVTLDDLTFGPDGGLLLTHGRLQVTGALGGGADATIEIDRAGQLWAETTTGRDPLALSLKGGRFVNTGDFSSPVTLTATGGQTILASGGARFRAEAQSRVSIKGPAARIGFDGDTDAPALLRFTPGATLEFIAGQEGVSALEEFRSGAFGPAPAVQSGVDLGGAALQVRLTSPTSLDPLILVDVDEVVGRFGNVTVQGLADRDASVVINYKSDMVSVQLSAGTGRISMSTIGTEDIIDRDHTKIWNEMDIAVDASK